MSKQPLTLSFSEMSAATLRWVLLGALVIIVLLQVGLIALGQKTLTSLSDEVSSSVTTASSSEQTLRDLQSVDTLLSQQATTVEKSKLLVADKSNTYRYQDQIIQDITNYAGMAGITVTGFAFSASADGGDTAGAAAPAASTPSTGTAAAPTPAGVDPVNVSVTLAPGVSYESFYTFLQLLEGNLLHMQVESLNLASGGGGGADADASGSSDGNSIGLSTLSIRVYTQK